MRAYKSATVLLALPLVRAVSLADFTPRPTSLPTACEKIYLQTIDGCSANDWAKGTSATGCSEGCVGALAALSTQISAACGNQGVTGGNIIVAFLNGQGPQALCSNADSFLSAGGSLATSSLAASSSGAALPTTTPSGSTVETSGTPTMSTPPSVSHPITATSMTSTAASSGILIDSSAQPTASPTESSEGSSQTHMADSGGGSPFDNEGYTGSGTRHVFNPLMMALFTTIITLFTDLR